MEAGWVVGIPLLLELSKARMQCPGSGEKSRLSIVHHAPAFRDLAKQSVLL